MKNKVNYEMQMLKCAPLIKIAAAKLDKKCKKFALGSFSVENQRNGTPGQFEYLAEMVAKRDEWLNVCFAVRQAIADMPKKFRLLFYKRFVANQTNAALVSQIGASLSAFYRLVADCRRRFAKNLSDYGYTKQWFDKNFGKMLAEVIELVD